MYLLAFLEKGVDYFLSDHVYFVISGMLELLIDNLFFCWSRWYIMFIAFATYLLFRGPFT